MHDPLDPRAETRTPSAESRPATQPEAADKELPAAQLPSAMHAWLDGDMVADSALNGSEKEMALWKRIGAETGRRRRMTTPSHVQAQILAKLSDD